MIDPLIVDVVKNLGVPLAQVLGALWFIRKYVLPSTNGAQAKELTSQLTATLLTAQKEALQHHDLERTRHFDQLRRDLTTTIERQSELSRDDFRNAISSMLLELELNRRRGRTP